MSDDGIRTIKIDGVAVKSDVGLYNGGSESSVKEMLLLSVYGSPQQTKAVFASIASAKQLIVLPDDIYVRRSRDTTIRGRGWSVGYGKSQMIIWDENICQNAVWFGSDRKKSFERLIESRKIPFDTEFSDKFEKLLLKKKKLFELGGWGGLHGFAPKFSDDEACDLIIEEILSPKFLKPSSFKKAI